MAILITKEDSAWFRENMIDEIKREWDPEMVRYHVYFQKGHGFVSIDNSVLCCPWKTKDGRRWLPFDYGIGHVSMSDADDALWRSISFGNSRQDCRKFLAKFAKRDMTKEDLKKWFEQWN